VPVAPAFSQRFPQREHGLGKVRFADERVGPERLQQVVLEHERAVVFDEEQENVEDLRRERHGLAVAQELPVVGIQAERTELERRDGLGAHDPI
jgi:hypothetical protein